MSVENKHVDPIPPEVLAQAQAHINAAITLLSAYLLALTPSERHELPKMGDKTLAFVEKALDYARQYPQLCPSYLKITEFETDMKDAIGLRTVHISAK
jgi:hypothetical protein